MIFTDMRHFVDIGIDILLLSVKRMTPKNPKVLGCANTTRRNTKGGGDDGGSGMMAVVMMVAVV